MIGVPTSFGIALFLLNGLSYDTCAIVVSFIKPPRHAAATRSRSVSKQACVSSSSMSTTQRTARLRAGNAPPVTPASRVETMNGKPGSTKGPTASVVSAIALPPVAAADAARRFVARVAATARAHTASAPATGRRARANNPRSTTDDGHGFRRAPRLPALAILARQPPIDLGCVGDLHLRAVVEDLPRLAGAQRDDAEQHRLRQLRRILERRAGGAFALARIAPVFLVRHSDAGEGLRDFLRLGGERLGIDLRVVAVRLVRQVALVADEDAAASLTRKRDVRREHGEKATIVPREAHRRLVAARGELVAREHRERIRA